MVPWFVVEFDACARMSLRKLECRSASLIMIVGEYLLVFRIWGQVQSPPTGGSASVKVMSGIFVSIYDITGSCVCFVIVREFLV